MLSEWLGGIPNSNPHVHSGYAGATRLVDGFRRVAVDSVNDLRHPGGKGIARKQCLQSRSRGVGVTVAKRDLGKASKGPKVSRLEIERTPDIGHAGRIGT